MTREQLELNKARNILAIHLLNASDALAEASAACRNGGDSDVALVLLDAAEDVATAVRLLKLKIRGP